MSDKDESWSSYISNSVSSWWNSEESQGEETEPEIEEPSFSDEELGLFPSSENQTTEEYPDLEKQRLLDPSSDSMQESILTAPELSTTPVNSNLVNQAQLANLGINPKVIERLRKVYPYEKVRHKHATTPVPGGNYFVLLNLLKSDQTPIGDINDVIGEIKKIYGENWMFAYQKDKKELDRWLKKRALEHGQTVIQGRTQLVNKLKEKYNQKPGELAKLAEYIAVTLCYRIGLPYLFTAEVSESGFIPDGYFPSEYNPNTKSDLGKNLWLPRYEESDSLWYVGKDYKPLELQNEKEPGLRLKWRVWSVNESQNQSPFVDRFKVIKQIYGDYYIDEWRKEIYTTHPVCLLLGKYFKTEPEILKLADIVREKDISKRNAALSNIVNKAISDLSTSIDELKEDLHVDQEKNHYLEVDYVDWGSHQVLLAMAASELATGKNDPLIELIHKEMIPAMDRWTWSEIFNAGLMAVGLVLAVASMGTASFLVVPLFALEVLITISGVSMAAYDFFVAYQDSEQTRRDKLFGLIDSDLRGFESDSSAAMSGGMLLLEVLLTILWPPSKAALRTSRKAVVEALPEPTIAARIDVTPHSIDIPRVKAELPDVNIKSFDDLESPIDIPVDQSKGIGRREQGLLDNTSVNEFNQQRLIKSDPPAGPVKTKELEMTKTDKTVDDLLTHSEEVNLPVPAQHNRSLDEMIGDSDQIARGTTPQARMAETGRETLETTGRTATPTWADDFLETSEHFTQTATKSAPRNFDEVATSFDDLARNPAARGANVGDIDTTIPDNTVLVFDGKHKVWKDVDANGDVVIYHESVLDPSLGARKGTENRFYTATEMEIPEVQGMQRAHSLGQSTGFESPYGIRYAPAEVNLRIQNDGIEEVMRALRDTAEPGETFKVRMATKTHPGTLRLKEVSYSIEVSTRASSNVPRPSRKRLFEYRIAVGNDVPDPTIVSGMVEGSTRAGSARYLDRFSLPDRVATRMSRHTPVREFERAANFSTINRPDVIGQPASSLKNSELLKELGYEVYTLNGKNHIRRKPKLDSMGRERQKLTTVRRNGIDTIVIEGYEP